MRVHYLDDERYIYYSKDEECFKGSIYGIRFKAYGNIKQILRFLRNISSPWDLLQQEYVMGNDFCIEILG